MVILSVGYSTVVNAKYNMTYLYGAGDYIALVDSTKNTLDEVSPSYFDVGSNGHLVINSIDRNFVDTMHKKGIKVVPFFSNHWSRERGVAMFSQSEVVVEELVNAVITNNLDGVNVDIENMTEGSKKWYVEFVKLLREKMPVEKIVAVSVAANPKGWTTGWHGSYDYEELGKYADYLMIMAYDEHYEGGEAGSVASYDFIENSIKYALKYVQKEKIVLGLPLFARYWKTGAISGGAAASYIQVENLVSKYNGKVIYDEVSKSMKAIITIKETDTKPKIYGKTLDAGEYVFWYENNETIDDKLELINEYVNVYDKDIESHLFDRYHVFSSGDPHIDEIYLAEEGKYYRNAYNAEDRINNLRSNLRDAEIEEIENNKKNYQTSVYYIDIVNQLERMGDFIINISQDLEKYFVKK